MKSRASSRSTSSPPHATTASRSGVGRRAVMTTGVPPRGEKVMFRRAIRSGAERAPCSSHRGENLAQHDPHLELGEGGAEAAANPAPERDPRVGLGPVPELIRDRVDGEDSNGPAGSARTTTWRACARDDDTPKGLRRQIRRPPEAGAPLHRLVCRGRGVADQASKCFDLRAADGLELGDVSLYAARSRAGRSYAAYRVALRALALAASASRSLGGAEVTSWLRSSAEASAMVSTARSKAAALACDGFVEPLILRTYWSAAARTSSSVADGSKLWRVRMFRHMHGILDVTTRLEHACALTWLDRGITRWSAGLLQAILG